MGSFNDDSILLVVDMQNDFVREGGALYVPSFDEERKKIGLDEHFLKNINHIINEFPLENIYTTEDLHLKDSIEFNKFPVHCLNGTWGQEYISELNHIYLNTKKIIKGINSNIFSFSIMSSDNLTFIDNWRREGIKNIYLVGVAYDFCVGESAIDLAKQGFNVYIFRNLTKSVSEMTSKLMDEKLKLYNVNKLIA
ncbi:MAG: isochorismatase family protein [Candidatus Woesearchaeota archaeon]